MVQKETRALYNDGCTVTTLWSQRSGARSTTPWAHQIGALALASGRPLRSEGLSKALLLTPTPVSLRPGLIGTRRRAEKGRARLISQNHCTRDHTLCRAVLCSHQQCCRRLPLSGTRWYRQQGWVDVGNKARQHTRPSSLTCKAAPFIYKRGCASSNKRETDSSRSEFLRSIAHNHRTARFRPQASA